MHTLFWNETFNIGIESIDLQHRKLVDIINPLIIMDKDELQEDSFKKTRDELVSYIEFHFAYEEKYFEEFKYKNMGMHIQEHIYFIDKINDSLKGYYQVGLIHITELLDFLITWYMEHILKSDKNYVRRFKNNGLN